MDNTSRKKPQNSIKLFFELKYKILDSKIVIQNSNIKF